LETVPVRIVDVANDLDRIGLQLTENDEHAHTSPLDRARAINQLVLMGLPASELRKRGVKASEATLARRVANASQEVAALGESANLGLDDLAKIAEAEADLPEDIAGMVVEEIREAPGKIDHFLERARDEARRRRVYEDAVLELRQQGVKVIREDEFYDGFPKSNQFLWNLVDEYGNSVEPHDNCPGNVAYVSVIGSGDYANVQTRFVCMDYASHGHFTREDRARTTQEADRAATIEANRQAAQEGEVRRAWIKDVLFKRPLPKDTALLEMPVIYNQYQVSDASQAKGRALINFDDMGYGLTMSAAQAAKARLAWCIGVLEGGARRWVAVVVHGPGFGLVDEPLTGGGVLAGIDDGDGYAHFLELGEDGAHRAGTVCDDVGVSGVVHARDRVGDPHRAGLGGETNGLGVLAGSVGSVDGRAGSVACDIDADGDEAGTGRGELFARRRERVPNSEVDDARLAGEVLEIQVGALPSREGLVAPESEDLIERLRMPNSGMESQRVASVGVGGGEVWIR